MKPPVSPLYVVVLFLSAVSRANYRLKKNHQRLKEFVRDDLTQTCFINGCPGTGKTLLNMSMSLACEEVFIEELEEKLLDYELKHKYINFAKVRENPTEFKEHEEYIDIQVIKDINSKDRVVKCRFQKK